MLYLVLSHHRTAQLARLVRTLVQTSTTSQVAVHHDPSGDPLPPGALPADERVLLVERPLPVRWADFSQVAAVLHSLRWVLDRTSFDWLVLLSGQDYPVRPLRVVERELAACPWDALIEHRPVDAPSARLASTPDEFASRYFYRWLPVARGNPPSLPRAALRLVRLASAPLRPLVLWRSTPGGNWFVLLRRRRTPFSARLRCHRGSAWFSISHRAAVELDGFERRHPELARHYRRTFVPDESFVQTVLANHPGLALHGDYRRFIRWRPGAPNPEVLGMDDLPAVLASGAWFARKFDERVDATVLDRLDEIVRG